MKEMKGNGVRKGGRKQREIYFQEFSLAGLVIFFEVKTMHLWDDLKKKHERVRDERFV